MDKQKPNKPNIEVYSDDDSKITSTSATALATRSRNHPRKWLSSSSQVNVDQTSTRVTCEPVQNSTAASSSPLLAWLNVVRHIDSRHPHQVLIIGKQNIRFAIPPLQDALSLSLIDSRGQPSVPTPRARPHPPLQIQYLFALSLPLCSQIYAGCLVASTSFQKIACAM